MSGSRAGASAQGHIIQMDLALESLATASSLHLYVNTYAYAHRHASMEEKWRGSLPFQGTLEMLVDAFQFGHFGLADFA